MGFNLEYLSDGTVKGVLDLKNEDVDVRCRLRPNISQKAVAEEQRIIQASEEKRDIQE